MSAERDVNRIVRSWLRTDEHDSADAVLGIVLSRLDTTPQRRSWWPAQRAETMSNQIRIALAAAAVVVVSILAYNLLADGPDIGGQPTSGPTLTQPTSTTAARPSPSADPGVITGPGTAVLTPFRPDGFVMCPPTFISTDCTEDPRDDSMAFTIDVPEGWETDGFGAALVPEWIDAPDGANMLISRGNWLYSDPCRPDDSTGPDVPVGPTVAEFATALDTHPLLDVTTPVDVTLDGYSGKYLELHVPSDFSDCVRYRPLDGTLYAQGPGQLWGFWILDVEGIRVVVQSYEYPGTSAADRAELRAIVDSIQIAP